MTYASVTEVTSVFYNLKVSCKVMGIPKIASGEWNNFSLLSEPYKKSGREK